MQINERIINACQELARSRGLHNFTMDELAAQAGLSKRTVYRYFRSKEDIIEASLDKFMEGAATELERILHAQEKPLEIINHMFNYLFANGQFIVSSPGLNDLRQYYPHLWQKIDRFRVQRIKELIEVLTKNSQNNVIASIDPRILTAIITASIQAVLNPDFILENNLTFEETANQLSSLMGNIFINKS